MTPAHTVSSNEPGQLRHLVERLIERDAGVLRLGPAFVARDFLPPGRRLGLPEDAYDLGDRGAICERWLASTTRADNRVGPEDEGLSTITTEGPSLLLKEAVDAAPDLVMGEAYAASHPGGLGRLAKIFDYAYRLPFHVHLPSEYAALVGANPKDEAYHFLPDVDMGAHPESFLGLHSWLSAETAHEVLLPYLVDWNSDLILRHSRAELQVAGEGFLVPSGVLHAPGTALTLELQEDSDVLAMFQALNAGTIISKELLFKDVRPEDRAAEGERFPLRFVDWASNGDPFFYENHHLTPQPVRESAPVRGEDLVTESWVFYGTTKFAGKRLLIRPGGSATLAEPGVYSVFVWSGQGRYAGQEIQGQSPGRDELLVCHDAAIQPHEVVNTGQEDLMIFTFFGPDLHHGTPSIRTPEGAA